MKAIRMFKKLGYKFENINFKDKFIRYEYIKEEKLANFGVRKQRIWFDLISKEIFIYNSIGIEELKAINKQCEELGWL